MQIRIKYELSTGILPTFNAHILKVIYKSGVSIPYFYDCRDDFGESLKTFIKTTSPIRY